MALCLSGLTLRADGAAVLSTAPSAVMFRRSELPPWCRWLLVHTLLSCVRGEALLWHCMLHLRAFAVLTLTAGMELKSLSSACHDGGMGL